MKFVVDAHLPRRLAYRLREMGYGTLHTLDLPNGNRTTDAEINRIAEQEQRIVVTQRCRPCELIRCDPQTLQVVVGVNRNRDAVRSAMQS